MSLLKWPEMDLIPVSRILPDRKQVIFIKKFGWQDLAGNSSLVVFNRKKCFENQNMIDLDKILMIF